MFCPNCHVYMGEAHLIKSNAKVMSDIAVEYDAKCPNCKTHIGRMFWGELRVAPGLTPYQPIDYHRPPEEPEPPEEETAAEPTEEPFFQEELTEEDRFAEDPSIPSPQRRSYFCPHCGKILPDDLSQLPTM